MMYEIVHTTSTILTPWQNFFYVSGVFIWAIMAVVGICTTLILYINAVDGRGK